MFISLKYTILQCIYPIMQVHDLYLVLHKLLFPFSLLELQIHLPVVYYGYLQSTKSTMATYLESTMGTCNLLSQLPAVYYAMGTCSLLWLTVVYYGYIPIASLPCCLVFCTQILYYAYLIFIITAFVLLSLHYTVPT